MNQYLMDRSMLIFFLICLPIFYWVFFDTERCMRSGNPWRKTPFTRSEILTLKVPAGLCAFGGTIWILLTLAYMLWQRWVR